MSAPIQYYGRKRSGIIKELSAKLDEWLATITDEDLRRRAGANTILTGGAIASMLLGEKVHDFDIYFRTQKVAFDVASYYVKGIAEVGAVGEVKICDMVNIKGAVESRVIVSIPSSGVVDVEGRATEPEPVKLPYSVSFMSENAITLTDSVQLITRFYGEPEQIHDNYDFAHAQCYWDHGTKKLVLPAHALECLLSRTLHYTGSLYPIASIFRMKKFIERGWRITAGQQLKIMWQISEINLRDPTTLREQLTGVDMAYMYELIEAMKDVPADKIHSTYVGEIIDRIFS